MGGRTGGRKKRRLRWMIYSGTNSRRPAWIRVRFPPPSNGGLSLPFTRGVGKKELQQNRWVLCIAPIQLNSNPVVTCKYQFLHWFVIILRCSCGSMKVKIRSLPLHSVWLYTLAHFNSGVGWGGGTVVPGRRARGPENWWPKKYF